MKFDASHEMEALKETQVASEEIFDGFILHVKKDLVALPNGRLRTGKLSGISGQFASFR